MSVYREIVVKRGDSGCLDYTYPYRDEPDQDEDNGIIYYEYFDNLAIDIDILQMYLYQLKKEGASHVIIDFNTDHIEYEFIGTKYEKI